MRQYFSTIQKSKSTFSTKSSFLNLTLLKSKKYCALVRVITGVGIPIFSAKSMNALVIPEKVLKFVNPIL